MKLDFLYTRQQPYQKRKIQRYDFCFLRRALGPPNFFDSVCLLSPDRRCLSYSVIFFLISSRILFVRGCSFGSLPPFSWPVRAREIATALANACPIKPPPWTWTSMSILLRNSPMSVSGVSKSSFAISGVTSSAGLLFILIFPVPLAIVATALLVLRCPGYSSILFIILPSILSAWQLRQ